jgi:hypothetical protein
VVSLQALFVILTVALLAYVNSAPTFLLRVDAIFAVLASLPVLGLAAIVRSHVKPEAGEVSVCTKPIRDYARQAMIPDIAIVVGVFAPHAAASMRPAGGPQDLPRRLSADRRPACGTAASRCI